MHLFLTPCLNRETLAANSKDRLRSAVYSGAKPAEWRGAPNSLLWGGRGVRSGHSQQREMIFTSSSSINALPKSCVSVIAAHTDTQDRCIVANLTHYIWSFWQSGEIFSLLWRHRVQREVRLLCCAAGAQFSWGGREIQIQCWRNVNLTKLWKTKVILQMWTRCRINSPIREFQSLHGLRHLLWEMEEETTKTELILRQ